MYVHSKKKKKRDGCMNEDLPDRYKLRMELLASTKPLKSANPALPKVFCKIEGIPQNNSTKSSLTYRKSDKNIT